MRRLRRRPIEQARPCYRTCGNLVMIGRRSIMVGAGGGHDQRALAEEFFEDLGRYRFAAVKALRRETTVCLKELGLRGALDALGNYLELQAVRHGDDGGDDGG